MVKKAFKEKRVKSFPTCFRCGKAECGNDDCNNILIPSQVAVVLSYQSLFKRIANGLDDIVLICEDDIVFAGYAREVLTALEVEACLTSAFSKPDSPFLLRLCSPNRPDYFFHQSAPKEISITNEIIMSNPGYIINRSFARLAASRLENIDHTADVIIHRDLSERTNAFTLRPQVVSDRSWSTGECESLIHPKTNHIENLISIHGANGKIVQLAKERFTNHLKKAVVVDYAFIGSPRCGSHFVSQFLLGNGFDARHEALGKDGLCAWQYTVDYNSHPYISDPRCRDSYFVYPKHYILYVRNPQQAIASLILENEQAPLSYSHRRKMILEHLKIDLDEFSDREERAARSYIHWYELALKRPLEGIVRVEHLYDDLRQIKCFEAIVDISVSKQDSGAGKPYLGVVHERIEMSPDWYLKLSRDTILRLDMISKQFGYTGFGISPSTGI
jgi:GR25 family glycosyltransferase involved in LPS biosynthesis